MTGRPSPVLVVEDVSKTFYAGGVGSIALDHVSFRLDAARTIAVVGESGAGKSTLARIVCGIERPTRGSVTIDDRVPRLRSGVRSPVQLVFQQPADALNPFLSVGASVAESLGHLPRRQRRQRVAELFEDVGLDPGRARHRPQAFSGGQLQRIVIARALAAEPRLLICDEPTSALDVSVQAQIINLLLRLQHRHGFPCLLITHDLGVARVLAHEVLVLRQGSVVEHDEAERFFRHPSSVYGRHLLSATKGEHLAG